MSQVFPEGAKGSELGGTISTASHFHTHRFFLYQILRGLKCIHSANVLHRNRGIAGGFCFKGGSDWMVYERVFLRFEKTSG